MRFPVSDAEVSNVLSTGRSHGLFDCLPVMHESIERGAEMVIRKARGELVA